MRFVVTSEFEGFTPGQVIEIDADTLEGKTGRRLTRDESRRILSRHLHQLQPLETPYPATPPRHGHLQAIPGGQQAAG